MLETVLVLSPLLAAFIAGVFQRVLGDRVAMVLTTGLVALAAVLSIYIFVDLTWFGGAPRTIELFPFIHVGGFNSTWSIRIDALSATMLVVVTSVSFLVHLYSWGYMAEDPHRARFFSYLSFFTFAMLALVTANDFLQLFFGWEGVGVASYLLIGFWYQKRSANDAAIKAFVVNRVGDFGFALGIMACFFFMGTIKFFPTTLTDMAIFSGMVDGVMVAGQMQSLTGAAFPLGAWMVKPVELICILLFVGAMGKSAQFFLHTWLPDAMEGPTPVSALIHAATMVTAGVFMVCRCSSMYEMAPIASAMVTLIGATTAIFAATIGLAQNDIKRVIAYSTCSQLGYMFFAAGVGAYGAAMFHLFTHAFFKALLFLGAGSVIHGMHHEQDMRFMGGVRRPMQFTWVMMLIGTFALIGFGIPGTAIGFAGFFSKDAIIESAYAGQMEGRMFADIAFWCGVSAALLTSFYSWRLMFMTFEGKYRENPNAHHDDHGHDAHGHDAHGHDDHAHGRDDHGHAQENHANKPLPAGAAPAHESPRVMLIPLALLAAGALFAGVLFKPYFLTKEADGFWRGAIERSGDPLYGPNGVHPYPKPEKAAKADDHSVSGAVHGEGKAEAAHAEGGHHELPAWVIWAPFVVTLTGFLGAVFFYLLNQGLGARIGQRSGPLHAFLSNKWYFDELYDFVFVKGARALGDLFWKTGDQKVIDGIGPNGFAAAARFGSRQLRRLQSGFVYHYSFLMLAAAVGFGAYALWASWGGR
jgi:NADH-quinone oxidoreductase subunit L